MPESLKILVIGALFGVVAWKIRDHLSSDDETGEAATEPDLIDYGQQALDQGSTYFYADDDMTAQTNLDAFLQAIRYGEGTSAANGYSIKVGGGTFDGFAQHPALLGWRGWQMPLAMAQAAGFPNGAVSTAAGAYQINRPTWKRISAKLNLADFTPASQDAAAIELIREKGALGDINAGRIAQAVAKVAKIWASLPGAGYGQNEVGMNTFFNHYNNAGGQLA